MLPTEQAKFFELVTRTLNAYGKFPETRELEVWWHECHGLTLEGLGSALKSHREDQDRGDRAPRPVDIMRRMKTGSRDGNRCCAVDVAFGRCNYPGTVSDGTTGDGPWFCSWHRIDRSGPESAKWIEISQNTPYEVAIARRVQRMTTESQRSPGVLATAWACAHNARGERAGNLGVLLSSFNRDEQAA